MARAWALLIAEVLERLAQELVGLRDKLKYTDISRHLSEWAEFSDL